jgi:glyoxylase-like metal-dependent hydrolase (beta-lactamase superfamily II)
MQTLFCGDLVFNDRIPSLRDGDINGWIKALEMLRALNAMYIVGGHGDKVGSSALDLTFDYLSQLRNEVKAAIDNDVAIDDAVKEIKMAEFSSVSLYDVMHAQNVEAAYRMLEWADE